MTVVIRMHGVTRLCTLSSIKIDTKTKMLTFSDGLNWKKRGYCINILKIVFKSVLALGQTTNDMGQTPLNIVLKLVECNGQSVAKISSSGKTMTDNETFLAIFKTGV